MTIEQIIVLAIVQGITEFLPISSSGHLLIIPAFTGWSDQGLTSDIMVHVGSLAAIIAYFWRDVLMLIGGAFDLVRLQMSDRARMALYIVLGTVPAVVFALILKKTGLLDTIRADASLKLQIVAWNAIIFGVLLYVADHLGPRLKTMEAMTLPPAMIIGLAQALALIPGTSRSGITMTAARMLGFERPEAARFSFLLGMPAIAGAGLLTFLEARKNGVAISSDQWLAAGFSFLASIAAITILMALVKRMSFLPFTLYRLALGGALLVLASQGMG
ncbi:MAG TPA: undecaprenyl-diphosphate phosphatase [Gammaproteobacteria bacterium]|nr:undecaprenyl-diphosphate phosphatase [Gammaproteobacteria bacterium]